MTGQPPEETERIYTGQYGGGYSEQARQYASDPFADAQYSGASQYGEPRYRETPDDYTLPGGPVSYDTTAFETPASPPDYAGYPGYDQGFDQQGMGQQGMGQQGAPGQPGVGAGQPGPPHPGTRHQGHAPRARVGGAASKSMLNGLFDTGFSSFITPTIVSSLYKLSMAAFALAAVAFIVFAFAMNLIFGVVTLFIIAPVLFVAGVAFTRVILELCLVTFRMADDLKAAGGRDGA